MTPEVQKPLSVFCSYAHEDEEHLNVLREWLRGLERRELIEWWHDREISPGWEWQEAIDRNLRTADIILLLVTPDFMASDYVFERELNRAIERHERGEARVIPIIVRPSLWKGTPLSQLQALPKDAKPITRWPDRDEAWLDVTEGIQKAVEELFVERQKRAAAKERYRRAVDELWADNKVSDTEAERLGALASELALSADTAADIEQLVMGDTKEAILERQERLKRLYDQARELYQKQEWQEVIDVFEQIHAEDTKYPDPEGLLASAHEALKTAQEEEALREYREVVESAWADGALDSGEVETLSDLADKLQLSPSHAGEIERGVIGDTKEAILWSQERSAKEQYRKAVKEAWTDNYLSNADAEGLGTLASELSLSKDTAAEIEGGVMGDTRQTILEHQEEEAVATLYAEGQRHMNAKRWQQALECFEEVQQLKPSYREIEELLSRVRQELARSSTVTVPDLGGQEIPQARALLGNNSLKLGGQHTAASDTISEGLIIEQSPEAGTEVEVNSSVSVTVSLGSRTPGPHPPLRMLGRNWWALALAGLINAIHGVVDLLFLGSGAFYRLSVSSLLIAIGVFIIIANSSAHPRLLLRTQGIISGSAGLVAFLSGAIIFSDSPANYSNFTEVLQYGPFFVIHISALALWGICIGIIQIIVAIIVAIRTRWDFRVMRLMLVSGTFVVLYGIRVFDSMVKWVNPGPWLLAILLLVSGISLVAFAFKVRQREESEVGG